MNVREIQIRAALTMDSVMLAVKELEKLEAGALEGPIFFELQFAPDAGECDAAIKVGHQLLKAGFGVRIGVHWPFRNTRSWAIQTDRNRLVNLGPEIERKQAKAV